MDAPLNILLVEDEVIAAMLMERQLKRMGFLVSNHVTTGEQAIQSALDSPPDIIIMDIQLAGSLDGIETAIEIRNNSQVPILFLTGFENPAFRERAQAVNPIGYLIKPMNEPLIKELIETVRGGL